MHGTMNIKKKPISSATLLNTNAWKSFHNIYNLFTIWFFNYCLFNDAVGNSGGMAFIITIWSVIGKEVDSCSYRRTSDWTAGCWAK